MRIGELKYYNKYMKILTKYANSLGLKIVYANIDCGGIYLPFQRKILLDPDMEETETVATLLHELGHNLDDLIHNPKTAQHYDAAYKATYKNQATKRQLKIVLECEVRAWIIGKSLAGQLRIKIGKWYDHEVKVSLKGYRTSQE